MSEQILKSQPTPGDVHINRPLTNISVAYIQRTGFVADQVFPSVGVEQKSDSYYIYNRDDFWRDEAKLRGPGTESAGGGFSLSTATYNCQVRAFHYDIADQTRANADSVLALDTSATEWVSQKLTIARERNWASSYFTTGVWGTDVVGVTGAPAGGQFQRWDVSTSTPLKDIELGKVKIAQETGFVPNTMVIGYQTLSALRDHPAIRDQFKYTSAESINEAMLARFFGIQRLFVMSGVFSTGNEGGVQTAQFIGGKSVLLTYSAPAPSLMTPTAGYTFVWRGLIGAQGGVRIKRFRMEALESDRIEGQMAYDMKVVAPQMGYFLSAVVS